MNLWHLLQAHPVAVIGCLVAAVFVLRRYLGTVVLPQRRRLMRSAGAILGLVSLVVVVRIAARGLAADPSVGRRFAAVPFRDLWAAGAESTDDVKQMIGNVLMFVPLGVAGRLIWPHITVRRVVASALMFSLLIEVTQYAMAAGRLFDTTDVLLNALGAAVGYGCLAGRPIERLRTAAAHE